MVVCEFLAHAKALRRLDKRLPMVRQLQMNLIMLILLPSYATSFKFADATNSHAMVETHNLHDCKVQLHGMEATTRENEAHWRNAEKKVIKLESLLIDALAEEANLKKELRI